MPLAQRTAPEPKGRVSRGRVCSTRAASLAARTPLSQWLRDSIPGNLPGPLNMRRTWSHMSGDSLTPAAHSAGGAGPRLRVHLDGEGLRGPHPPRLLRPRLRPAPVSPPLAAAAACAHLHYESAVNVFAGTTSSRTGRCTLASWWSSGSWPTRALRPEASPSSPAPYARQSFALRLRPRS